MTQQSTESGTTEGAALSAPAPPPPAIDVQAQITQALAAQQAAHAQELKEATGHESLAALKEQQLKDQGKLQELLDVKAAEALQFKGKYEQTQITNALLTAADNALDAELISALLFNNAVVDGNGVVTIGGKPVKEAVTELLTAKPFLAKPQGGTGSGSANTPVAPTTANDYATAAKNRDVLAMLATNPGVIK